MWMRRRQEEITLSKILEMADKLKMYCLREGFPDAHPQVPSIRKKHNELYHQKPQAGLSIYI